MGQDVWYTYWFEKNLQGDIVAVYYQDGTKIASYTYDAWGNCTKTTLLSAGVYSYAQYNPFRYRGYYYDTTTGYYYLQSRYYNPGWGRFLNADTYLNANGDILGYNLFAYCSNNPVMGYDPEGTLNWGNILKAVAVVVVVTAVVAITVATVGAAAVAVGAVSSTVAVAAATGAVVGGFAAGTAEIVSQCATKGSDNLDYKDIAIETFSGSIHGAIDGILATTGSAGARIAGRVGKVAISGAINALHGMNHGDSATTIFRSSAKSMGIAALVQGSMLGMDGLVGNLSPSLLDQKLLDGALCYNAQRIATTIAIRMSVNFVSHSQDFVNKIFD